MCDADWRHAFFLLILVNYVDKGNEMPIDVKRLRRKTYLNQANFGAKLGVTKQAVSKYENGTKIPKTMEILIKEVYKKYL